MFEFCNKFQAVNIVWINLYD